MNKINEFESLDFVLFLTSTDDDAQEALTDMPPRSEEVLVIYYFFHALFHIFDLRLHQ